VGLALVGAVLAPLRLDEYSGAALGASLRSNPWPYLLALCAAALWALYSVLSRRWAADAEGGAVPLFAVAAGLALGALRPFFPAPMAWTVRPVVELGFMALLPTLVAYAFWDRAMRRGNVTLVAALSYLIPVLSTLVISRYLHVRVGWNVWLACGLIVAGAIVCERAVVRAAA